MKLNLRKSAAIQQEILQTIKSLVNFDTKIEFDEFDSNIEDKFEKTKTAYISNQRLITNLYTVYYAIRNEVAILNQQVGINNLLNEIELAKKLMAVYLTTTDASPSMDIATINLRLAKIRDADKSNYYYEKTVETTCVTADLIKEAEQIIAKFKQRIRDLSDELLELNVQTKITLNEQQFQILVQAGLYLKNRTEDKRLI